MKFPFSVFITFINFLYRSIEYFRITSICAVWEHVGLFVVSRSFFLAPPKGTVAALSGLLSVK